MTSLVFIMAALLALSCSVVIVALRRKKTDSEALRETAQASLKLLRERFETLKSQHAAGTISREEFEREKEDLERQVLEADIGSSNSVGNGRSAWLGVGLSGGIICLSLFIYIMVGFPTAADEAFTPMQTVRMQTEQGQATGNSGKDQMPSDETHADSAQLRAQLADLEIKLKKDPENPDGWYLLAKTYQMLREWDKSAAAYEQLISRFPNNPNLLADFADIEAVRTGGKFDGRPMELIDRALKLDPKHEKALNLKGTYEYNRGNFAEAIRNWKLMRSNFNPGSEGWEYANRVIEDARRAGNLPESGDSALSEAVDAKKAAPKINPNARIAGRVEIDPAIKARIKPTDTVFVYARSANGESKMPIAFINVPVSELPKDFVLDEATSMGVGGLSISDVTEAVLEARVSHSGNFIARSGDLEGRIEKPVKVGSEGHVIRIEHVVP